MINKPVIPRRDGEAGDRVYEGTIGWRPRTWENGRHFLWSVPPLLSIRFQGEKVRHLAMAIMIMRSYIRGMWAWSVEDGPDSWLRG
jgi:hypothetical protein